MNRIYKLNTLRQFYPELSNMTDYELGKAVHNQYFQDMDYSEYANLAEAPLEEDPAEAAAIQYNQANPLAEQVTAQDIRDKDRSGFFGTIAQVAESGYDAVTDVLPMHLAQAWRGGDIKPEAERGFIDNFAQGFIDRNQQDLREHVPSIQEVTGEGLASDIRSGIASVPTSMVATLGGATVGKVGGHAAGSVGGPIGSAIGGTVGSIAGALGGSGAIFYRMAKDTFMQEAYDIAIRDLGRELTSQELDNLSRALDEDATEFGLWEAGPEAISSVIGFGAMGVAGKYLASLGLGRAVKSMGQRAAEKLGSRTVSGSKALGALGGAAASETITEGITFAGQENIRHDWAMRDTEPTASEYVEDVLPSVLIGTAANLGAGSLAMGGINYLKPRSQVVSVDLVEPEATPEALDQGRLALNEGVLPLSDRPSGSGDSGGPSQGPISLPSQVALPSLQDTSPAQGINNVQDNLPVVQRQPINPNLSAESQIAPTQAQITSTHEAPRADTMAAAQTLGVPAPQPVATPEMPTMPAPSIEPVQTQDTLTPQSELGARMPLSDRIVVGGVPQFNEPRSSASTVSPVSPEMPQTPLVGQPAATPTEELERKQSRFKPVGTNEEGLSIFTDNNGVRYIEEEQGIFIPQANRKASTPIEMFSIEDQRRYLTSEELRTIESSIAGEFADIEYNVSDTSLQPQSEPTSLHSSLNRAEYENKNIETPSERKGTKTTLKVPNSDDESVTYEVVEAGELQASHMSTQAFSKNRNYGLENERMYHKEPASQTKVLQQARQLDPSFLVTPSIDGNHGAPVVDRNNNVLGGNGRTMSIQYAAQNIPSNYEKYKKYLLDNAEQFGLSKDEINKMQVPVLVRRMDRDLKSDEAQAFISKLNDTFTHSQKKDTVAKSRGDRLSEKTLGIIAAGMETSDTLRQYFDTPESLLAVESLVADKVITEEEKNSYITNEGYLNPDGKTLVEQSLRGALGRTYEAIANLPDSLSAKVEAISPFVLSLESSNKSWSIKDHVTDAIDVLNAFALEKLKANEKDVAFFYKKIDMFNNKTVQDRYSKEALVMFENILLEKKAPLVAKVKKYNGQAKVSEESGALPNLVPTQDKAFKNIFEDGTVVSREYVSKPAAEQNIPVQEKTVAEPKASETQEKPASTKAEPLTNKEFAEQYKSSLEDLKTLVQQDADFVEASLAKDFDAARIAFGKAMNRAVLGKIDSDAEFYNLINKQPELRSYAYDLIFGQTYKKTEPLGEGVSNEPAVNNSTEPTVRPDMGEQSSLQDDLSVRDAISSVQREQGTTDEAARPQPSESRPNTRAPESEGRPNGNRDNGNSERSDLPDSDSGRTNEDADEIASGRDTKLAEQNERGRQNSNNYRLTTEDIKPKTPEQRIQANFAAIRTLKKIQAENRPATKEEQSILQGYSGWGSFSEKVFKNTYISYAMGRYSFRPEGYDAWVSKYGKHIIPELGGVMTNAEISSAMASVESSYYTAPEVVSYMWDIVEKLGFKGGRILEPSAGSGVFYGLMPQSISDNSNLMAVELETTTGNILKLLYPDAKVYVKGLEETAQVKDNAFDLVIGNVPFSEDSVYDKNRPELSKQSLHNYFISRSIDSVRAGGLVAVITSRHSMDSVSSRTIREQWNDKAELVTAVRLPNNAFKESAGTTVVTDILVFRKRGDVKEIPYTRFTESYSTTIEDQEISVNEFFQNNPDNIIGVQTTESGPYGMRYTVSSVKLDEQEKALDKVISALPNDITDVVNRPTDIVENLEADESMKQGALVEKDGKYYFVLNGELVDPELTSKDKPMISSYMGLKKEAIELIDLMRTDASDLQISDKQEKLNRAYENYLKNAKKPINAIAQNSALRDDIEFETVAALENTWTETEKNKQGKEVKVLKAEKADIFTKRTIKPFKEPDVAHTINDAISISLVYRNKISVPYISRLLDISQEQAIAELNGLSNVFLNPVTNEFEEANKYLSGNVVKKHNEAVIAIETQGKEFEKNATALEDVLPESIKASDIYVKIGTAWITADIYNAFAESVGVLNARVQEARIDGPDGIHGWEISGRPDGDISLQWQTAKINVIDLLRNALNLKVPTIYDTDPTDSRKKTKNVAETIAAQEIVYKLQDEFVKFIANNKEYAAIVEDTYNSKFNNYVIREYQTPDIKHYPNANTSIELRENQKKGVARALTESTILAHGVGSGKTFLLITLAMEMRRLGTAQKPWVVVQGSTVGQFASSFKKLYPSAKILVPSENQQKNKERLLAQIATGDFDAIITPHSFFNSISVSPETEINFINARKAELEAMLEMGGNNVTRREIEAKIKRLENRIKKINDRVSKKINLYFEQLGIDALLIDEAHMYKRGDFDTKMGNVKGLDKQSSGQSMQLLIKSKLIQDKTGGKNIILATGTPISNTISEFWTMMRYVRPDLLEDYNISLFDEFASTFATTTLDGEYTDTGEYKQIERFNKYTNTTQLSTLWRSAADIAITEDLSEISNYPQLENGRIQEIVIEKNEQLNEYINRLRLIKLEWEQSSGAHKKANPHIPLVVHNNAKKAAIDLRLVDKDTPNMGITKADVLSEKAFNIYVDNEDKKSTQIIFSDLFQDPTKSFNLFKEIKRQLVERGVPEHEIAIIHDYKNDKARELLFESVNTGEIRFIMGTTEKLGTGVNIQNKLIAAHHLDIPARPMDFEQRNGRIRRPNNENKEIQIYVYGTKDTMDSVAFDRLLKKQRFIVQLMKGEITGKEVENIVDESMETFNEMIAAMSGNPLVKMKSDAEAIVRKLEALSHSYEMNKGSLNNKLLSENFVLKVNKENIEKNNGIEKASAQMLNNKGLVNKNAIKEQVSSLLEQAKKDVLSSIAKVTSYEQFVIMKKEDSTVRFNLKLNPETTVTVAVKPNVTKLDNKTIEKGTDTTFKLESSLYPALNTYETEFSGSGGLITRVENILKNAKDYIDKTEKEIAQTEKSIESLRAQIAKPFEKQEELAEARRTLIEVEQKLEQELNAEAESLLQDSSVTQPENIDSDVTMQSFAPSAFLENREAAKIDDNKKIAKKIEELSGKFPNAIKAIVLDRYDQLPIELQTHAENLQGSIEGLYDTSTGNIYIIAGNIGTTERAGAVWLHEQMHKGLRSLFNSKKEMSDFLRQLFNEMGGLGNKELKELSEAYGLNPTKNDADVSTLMEEYIAKTGEKVNLSEELTKNEKGLWSRLIEAVKRLFRRMIGKGSADIKVEELVNKIGENIITGESKNVLKDAVPRTLAAINFKNLFKGGVKEAAKASETVEVKSKMNKDDISILSKVVSLPHWVAKSAPEFARIYEAQLHRMDERATDLKRSIEEVPSLFGSNRIKGKDREKLIDLIWKYDGRSIDELGDTSKYKVIEERNGRKFIALNSEYYTKYRQWLNGLSGYNDRVKDAFFEIRKSLDTDLMVAHNKMAELSEVADNTIDEFRTTINQIQNYFPHHRYGDYYVQAVYDGQVVYREHYDALNDSLALSYAQKVASEFNRTKKPDNVQIKWSSGKNTKLPDDVLGAPIDTEAMEQIIKTAAQNIKDPEQRKQVIDMIYESTASVLKTRGWSSHALGRKNVDGFERQDIERVLFDYKSGLNGWITKIETARDFSSSLYSIDAKQKPELWKYASQYVKDMLRNHDRVDRIVGNIKGIAFIWYLGGSIKTAFVNLTQNIIVGLPRLQMDTKGMSAEYFKASMDSLVDMFTGRKGKKLSGDEARLLHELYKANIITDAFMHEIRGQMSGFAVANMWNEVTRVLGLPMSEAEIFNRASLALTAYRIAAKGNLTDKAKEKYGIQGKPTYEQLKAFVTDVVRDSHFVYGKSNLPEAFRSNTTGRMASPMYTFRTFSHNLISLWAWALKTQGLRGASFMLKSFAATAAIGGVTALPFYSTLMAIIQSISEDDETWTAKIRKFLPENNMLRDMVLYGGPSIAGINFGGSLKMETPLTRGFQAGGTLKEIFAESLGSIVGIPYDLFITRPSNVLRALEHDNYWRALEEAAPVFVKNAMQSYRLLIEGQTTMSGRPINVIGEQGPRQLNVAESLGKLLGFQPVSSTKSYEAYAGKKQSDKVRSDKINEFTLMALQSYDTGDSKYRRQMAKELQEWNKEKIAEDKRHLLITIKDVDRRVKSRRRDNAINPKNMYLRERAKEDYGI